jgi:acetyl esterase/lipase
MTGEIPLQPSPSRHLSPEDWARLCAVNSRWNDDIVAHRKVVLDIYTPLVRATDNSGIAVTRDVAYGPDPRHRLDIFTPGSSDNRPVLMFIHGGAFTRGAKSANGEIYDNVPLWFARQGFIGINVEYRLAPAATFPAGAQDIGLAVEWVTENVVGRDGKASRIILMGHSAGGAHVATYLLDPCLATEPSPSIAAAVLVSARLRLDALADNPNAKNVAIYCGGDSPDLLKRYSPVSYVNRCRWPILLAVAEFENRHLDRYGYEFGAALASVQGHGSRLIRMPGHNHTSIVAHFNTAEETFGREILAFLSAIPRRSADEQANQQPL